MSEIQSLTEEIVRLTNSVASWNTGIIVMMVVAALAASGLVVTQFVAFKKAGELAKIAKQLNDAKDRQLAEDLKEKDLKIAEANEQAEEAKLALAKFKAPRKLTEKQQSELVEKLKVFSGTVFDISANDNESLEFAVTIADPLIKAGWNCNLPSGDIVFNLPGRSYVVRQALAKGIVVQILDPNLTKAGDALVNTLTTDGFEGVVKTTPDASPNDPNKNVIHIIIGAKL